jgi:hypothetical protein
MIGFVIPAGALDVATTVGLAGLVAELQPVNQTVAPNSVMAIRYFIITSSVRRTDELTLTTESPFGNNFCKILIPEAVRIDLGTWSYLMKWCSKKDDTQDVASSSHPCESSQCSDAQSNAPSER